MPALRTDLPPEALRVLDGAREFGTPCGQGHIVWHAWGQGEPLVLLHGGSGSWTHWLRSIEPLVATGRQVLVPDLPGFGDSARPPQGGDADAVVAPLAQGLHELLGDTPVDIVAFSFGSIVAAFLAADLPQRVKRLVIVGAPVFPRGSDARLRLAAWRGLDDASRLAAHARNLQALMLHRPEAIDDTAIALQAANAERDRMRRRRISHTDATARALARTTCPLWAIYGQEDALYRERWQEAVEALQAIPNFRGLTTIAGAGHWVQYEDPRAFHEALARALD